MIQNRYDFFVSYNKTDVDFVERLVKRVESETYAGRPLSCFYDQWDIQPGENILLKIEGAHQNSRFVGLVMSPEWERSNWATLERVMPVYDDPAGIKGKIIPMLRRDCDIPPSIRVLKWLDFRKDTNFEREVQKLVARLKGENQFRPPIARSKELTSLSPSTAESELVSNQDEILASNLFPVTQIPRFVYVAHAKVKKRDEVWSMFSEGIQLPTFAIRETEQKIFSFANLMNPQHRLGELLTERSTETISTTEMVADKYCPVLIELLNRSMTEHMKSLGMTYDWKNKKTFFPLETNYEVARYATWRIAGREFKRALVKQSKAKNTYYVHRSCKATFTEIEGSLYLKILPGWHFTLEGISTPVSPSTMNALSARWMNIQRNHSVLDDVRFWAYILSKGSARISLYVGEDTPVMVSSTPLLAQIAFGIDADYRERQWFEAEPEVDDIEQMNEADDEVDVSEDASVEDGVKD